METRRVGGGLLTVAGIGGGVVLDHTIPESLKAWQVYGLWSAIGALCLIGLAMALWPARKKPMPENDKPRVIGPLVGVEIEAGKDLIFHDCTFENVHTAMKIGEVEGLRVTKSKFRNDVTPDQKPDEDGK